MPIASRHPFMEPGRFVKEVLKGSSLLRLFLTSALRPLLCHRRSDSRFGLQTHRATPSDSVTSGEAPRSGASMSEQQVTRSGKCLNLSVCKEAELRDSNGDSMQVQLCLLCNSMEDPQCTIHRLTPPCPLQVPLRCSLKLAVLGMPPPVGGAGVGLKFVRPPPLPPPPQEMCISENRIKIPRRTSL